MSNPVISVIIPAYNAQEYLRECLESVLAQSFQDFEAIVVNDGSTDSTLAIAESYAAKDSRIRVLTTSNQGVSCARNQGIDQATGDWITFIDSDDTLCTTGLGLMLKAAIRYKCDIVKGNWSRTVTPSREEKNDDKIVSLLGADEALEVILYQTKSHPSVWATLFNHRLFEQERFIPGKRYEDLDFTVRVFLQADAIAFIPDVVYFYRDNPASFINRFSPGRLDVLTVTETIENYMRRHKPALLPAARDRRLSANFNMFALLMLNTSASEYADQKRECWSIIKAYRRECLLNRKTRLKNKLGSLLSYFGRVPFLFVAKFIYR